MAKKKLKKIKLTEAKMVKFYEFVNEGPVTKHYTSNCKNWNGRFSAFGEVADPIFCVDGNWNKAHRVAWSWEKRMPLTKGMKVYRMCKNNMCVNVEHMNIGVDDLEGSIDPIQFWKWPEQMTSSDLKELSI